jgi:hypothetical protein
VFFRAIEKRRKPLFLLLRMAFSVAFQALPLISPSAFPSDRPLRVFGKSNILKFGLWVNPLK